MTYTTLSRRFHSRGNDGTKPPRTAGMRARSDGPLLPMKPTLWQRVLGRG
jgi:hypothetical protein